MKLLWALPAISAQLVKCSQQHFNVYEDPHAYPQFTVSIKESEPLSDDQAHSILNHGSADSKSPLRYHIMTKDNERFLCTIPWVEPTVSTTQSNQTAEEEEKELASATQRGWDLLKGMEGQCIYFMSGWWGYSFCYNQGVRQFHPKPNQVQAYPPVEDPTVTPYVLGRYADGEEYELEEIEDEEELKKNRRKKAYEAREKDALVSGKLEVKGQSRYLVQNLRGGTVCDLTGEERTIEVQFRCDDTLTDRITLVKETSICQYRMVISTPRLCNDVAFHPPQVAAPNSIDCRPVLSSEEIPKYLEDHSEGRRLENQATEKQTAAIDMIANQLMNELQQALGIDEAEIKNTGLESLTDSNDDELLAEALDTLLTAPNRIGDIEVGGNNLIPAGTKLQKGAIVGGPPRERIIGVIARSDGYVMEKAEMRKLKIYLEYSQDLDAVKKEMNKRAKGSDWQIIVVQTPMGQELRGIVGSFKENGIGNQGDEDYQDYQENPEAEADDSNEGSDETYKEEL